MSWDEWPECGIDDTIALINANPEDVIIFIDYQGWRTSGHADFAILEDDKHPTIRIDGLTAIAWQDSQGYYHKRPDIAHIINVSYYARSYYHLEER